MSDVLLSVTNLSKHFGALAAVNELNISVQKEQIHGLIGPNGAGKTTFVNMISGFLPATKGNCIFDGKEITLLPPHKITRLGLSRTYQQGQIFPHLTCLENVMVGRHYKIRSGFLKTMLRPPFIRSTEEDEARRQSMALLEQVDLNHIVERPVKDLTWVECQLLQIARALAGAPKLLVLDEPSAGMGAEESLSVGRLIRHVRDMGITIILISHDMKLVMDLADQITVINFGEKIAEGSPKEIQCDEKVLEAYLGAECVEG